MERQKIERRINRSFLVQDLRSWRQLLCRKVAQLLAKLQMVGLQLSWSSCAWKPAAGEWSGCMHTAVAAVQRDELRKVVQAAGLPAREAGGGWLPVAELREALVKHLAPQASASEQ